MKIDTRILDTVLLVGLGGVAYMMILNFGVFKQLLELL